ncbi:MAG: hypothetical protein CMB80_33915 [Flammeovirgaceae bacterium]|nr:hypothetical protein [Flammeovirgaceae bacterium]
MVCKNHLVHVLVFFFAIHFSLNAQDAHQKVDLEDLLERLEADYDTRFSYANESLIDLYILPIDNALTLDDWLDYLREVTPLKFDRLSGNIITVSPKIKPQSIVSISGVVIDAQNNDPIPFAFIQLGDQVASSDFNGYFTLTTSISSDSILQISHISYFSLQTSLIDIESKENVVLKLQPKFSTLSEVIIDNYYVPGISRVQGGGYRFKPDEQQILPGLTEPDLLFSLQTFPGIYSANESVSNLNIRGGTNDQNLVLWDGIRMFQTGHFFGLISAFNPYITESATVTKNGTVAELGQGVSGTFDMKLRESLRSKFEAGGGANLLHLNAHAGIPINEKLSIELAGRRSLTDMWQSPTYNSYFDRAFQNTAINRAQNNDSLINQGDKFLYFDWLGKINFHPTTKDRISVTYFNMGDELSFNEEKTFGSGNSSRESRLHQISSGIGITHTRFWNQNLKTLTTLYQSKYQLDATNQYLLIDQQLDQSNTVINRNASLSIFYLVNPRLDWQWGYQLDILAVRDQVFLNKPSFTSDIQEAQTSHILHGQVNWTQEETGTFVSFGTRLNFFPGADPQFIPEPRIRAHQYLQKNLLLELLGEFKSQTITQIIDLQNDFLGVEKRRWALANGSDYPIIQSKQVSLGLHYDLKDFFLSGEVYYKQVNNIISTSQAFQNQLEPLQIAGDYNSYGVDLMVKKSFGILNSWLSYGWGNTMYQFETSSVNNPNFPSNLDIRHNVYLGNSLKTGNFDWSIGANYHSGVPVTLPKQDDPILNGMINYQSPNSGRLPDYLRLDFSSTYKWLFKNDHYSLIGLSIWNVMNRDNPLKTYYRRVSNVPVAVDQLALGFTPNVSLQMQFYF